MAINAETVRGWIAELEVIASMNNNPILRHIANTLDEGVVTGRIYINEPNNEGKVNE
jgi:hypothetical protein